MGDAKGKKKQQQGLRRKLALLLLAIMTVVMLGNLGWRYAMLSTQAEHEMLQNTQVLAQEMDAVWEFMERNEGHFETDDNGVPILYCVVAAKSVSNIFTHDNTENYSIHYTNITTRKSADAPDAFELEALEAFSQPDGPTEYYALEQNAQGATEFRYAAPLFVTESCLKCHGEPAGEIDMVGYPKEGMKLGDLAGCASITMPADTYLGSIAQNLGQDAVVFSLILLAGLFVIYIGFSRSSRQLENMNDALERENRRQSDFLSMMSHEIRTPLTSICAFADIWSKKNKPRNEEESRIMTEMRASSQVLLAMVNNILDTARLSAGRSQLSLEPVEVPDLVGGVVDGLGFLAQKKRVRLEADVPLGIPLLMLDYEKVRRMLENLVSNAIKFVPEGGKVRIAVAFEPEADRLTLTVMDDGCGIAEEDVDYIFDRFVQGASRTEHRSGGSGLGLALVKELSVLHGGGVRLAHRGGGEGGAAPDYPGCTFEVWVTAHPCDTLEVEE